MAGRNGGRWVHDYTVEQAVSISSLLEALPWLPALLKVKPPS